MNDDILWPLIYFGLGYILGLAFLGFILIVNKIRSNGDLGVLKILRELIILVHFLAFAVSTLVIVQLVLEHTPDQSNEYINGSLLILSGVGMIIYAIWYFNKYVYKHGNSS